MTGVLKTILILVIVYYAWKLLFRLLFPIVAKKVVDKAQKNMNERMRNAYGDNQDDQRNHEGEVTIQKGAERKRPSVSDKEGDYVEFEEVED